MSVSTQIPETEAALSKAKETVVQFEGRQQQEAVSLEKLTAEEARLLEILQQLQAELAAQRSKLQAANDAAAALERRLAEVLQAAGKDVKRLSKQQLEEVRSLANPAPLVRVALGLVYVLLNPAQVSKYKTPADVPWKEKLAPMLKRDDLVKRLVEFPPAEEAHPLLAYPALAELIAQHVVVENGAPTEDSEAPSCGSSPTASKKMNSPLSGQRASVASAAAAKVLLSRRSGSKVDMAARSPSKGSSLVTATGPVEEAGAATPVRRKTVRQSTLGQSLLGDDGRLTLQAVEYASSAVGALFKWVLSQMRFAKALQEAGVDRVQAKVASAGAEHELLEAAERSAAEAVEAAEKEASASAAASSIGKTQLSETGDAVEKAKEEVARLEAELERLRKGKTQQEAAAPVAAAAASARPPAEEQPAEPVEPEARLEEVLDRGEVVLSAVEVEIRERITFGKGSAHMSSFATRAVQGVMKVLKENADVKICVEGHTSSAESDSVSTQRANAVLDLLVKNGVPRHRLRAAGFGASFPEGDKGSDNQRVEFSVIQEISIKGTVQFSPCSDSLTGSAKPLLDKVAALLLARPCLRVRVEGHTDNAPNWGCSNQELSEGRAQSVANFLNEKGIEMDRLAPVGFGESLPRTPNSSREGRTNNRRVEFHVLQRETVKGMRELLGEKKRRTAIDEHALKQLEKTASGSTVGLSWPIRVAAADLLIRLYADWPVQRLLYIAGRREDPHRCRLACLPDDCVRRILRSYFLLGCSSLHGVR
eukprot:TRINITY_DN16013_c0_g1_i1.p1 TRINITY_DN16013_c0_g1~~TRINITY_DN16013_c0_g1_i1.p1  ORF type:complete len:765 (+),score=204.31 TRINITY_DN16013_c0_g1_i1:119-2413(+)